MAARETTSTLKQRAAIERKAASLASSDEDRGFHLTRAAIYAHRAEQSSLF